MFSSLKNRKGGFTLIELLVVIAIIGILSAVVLASLSTARMKSRDAKRISDVGQIQLALELYFDSNQSYYPMPATTNQALSTAGWQAAFVTTGKFLPSLPVSPSGAAAYRYEGLTAASAECVGAAPPTTTCVNYIIAAQLERADNTVLSGDADVTTTGGTVIIGGNVACDATAAGGAGTEQCYDVKP